MKKEHTRLSLIDGSVETMQQGDNTKSRESLEPIFEEIVVRILILEGAEEVIQKRLVGFRERKI